MKRSYTTNGDTTKVENGSVTRGEKRALIKVLEDHVVLTIWGSQINNGIILLNTIRNTVDYNLKRICYLNVWVLLTAVKIGVCNSSFSL